MIPEVEQDRKKVCRDILNLCTQRPPMAADKKSKVGMKWEIFASDAERAAKNPYTTMGRLVFFRRVLTGYWRPALIDKK